MRIHKYAKTGKMNTKSIVDIMISFSASETFCDVITDATITQGIVKFKTNFVRL